MEYDYPNRVKSHITESESYLSMLKVLPDNWIDRQLTERDYGIDCLIEFCDEGQMKGKVIAVQLKGAIDLPIVQKDNAVKYRDIEPKSLNYWNNYPLPVLFLYIDVTKDIVYYSNIKKYIRKHFLEFSQQKITEIVIPKDDILTKQNSKQILEKLYFEEMNRTELESNINIFLSCFHNITAIYNDYAKKDADYGPEDFSAEYSTVIQMDTLISYFTELMNYSTRVESIEKIMTSTEAKKFEHSISCPYFTNYIIEASKIIINIYHYIWQEFFRSGDIMYRIKEMTNSFNFLNSDNAQEDLKILEKLSLLQKEKY